MKKREIFSTLDGLFQGWKTVDKVVRLLMKHVVFPDLASILFVYEGASLALAFQPCSFREEP